MGKIKRESLLYARIHTWDYERFKTAAVAQGMTISALIRKLVDDYVKWWEDGGEEIMLGQGATESQPEIQL